MKTYRFKFVRMALLGAMACCMLSCGTLKKNVNRNKSEENKSAEFSTVTTRTITEAVDTLINIPSARVQAVVPLDQFCETGLMVAENEVISTQVTYDKETKIIRVLGVKKNAQVPVKLNKTTVEQVNQHSKIETSAKTVTIEKSKQVHRLTWEFWLFWLMVICWAIWYVKKHWPFF